ncbi:hypothetical protein [Curtobacterium ammoniigenes]|uniref:hypothetical protein n=1 Tax=Curtobacterium ammoniigenes TaxID=395387 RepID=UPI00082CA529|nr:hypothetical protein [Curtobacterium ammoniigenes]
MSEAVPAPLDANADPQSLLDGLAAAARRALPASVVETVLSVERKRSLGDRMAGREGVVRSIRLAGVEETLILRDDNGRLVAEAARVSGGVIIARRQPPLGAWLAAFAGEVAAIAAETAGDSAAVATSLGRLGIRTADPFTVRDTDLSGGLAALEAAAATRLPASAADQVRRIVALLTDTVPRVVGGEPEIVVRRTATAYLPDTLRSFAALPSDWAQTHRLADGSTAAEALTRQLAELEAAATRMHDAAVEQDAGSLLVNGRFLEDRFRASSLDLD